MQKIGLNYKLLLLGVILLSSCATSQKEVELVDNSLSSQALAQHSKVMGQPNIDPLTDYIKQFRAVESAQILVAEVEKERAIRCERVGLLYEKREKTAETIQRLVDNYQYSCPNLVEAFASKWQLEPESTVEQPDQQKIQECKAEYIKGQFYSAQKDCASLAVNGDPMAQYYLAASYRGTNQLEQTLYWVEKSVEQGIAEAEFLLGDLYDKGEGVEVDPIKALAYKEKAAGQNYLEAQLDVATHYLQGIGVQSNTQMAKFWFTRAANKGSVIAQHQLGELYQNGALPVDAEKALHWFNKAARQGSKQAFYSLGKLYADQTQAVFNLPQAYLWLSLAAENGYSEAIPLRDSVKAKLSIEEIYTTDKLIKAFSLSS